MTAPPVVLVFTLAVLWGASYPLNKVAVETMQPLTVAALRALLAGLLLFALMGRKAPSLWRSHVPLPTYIVQAALNCIIPWTLLAWALRTIDASLAAVLNSLSPIFVFLLTWAVTRHEPATARKFVGVLLGMAGVAAIVGVDALSGAGKNTAAEIACLGGSLSYATAAIVGRRFDRLSPLVPAAGSTLVAAVVLIPLALVIEHPWQALPSLRSVLALAGLVVFATGAAFVVYFRLLSTIGSIGTASQSYLRIVVGVALGVFFLGEELSASLLAGVALVVAGVVAMTLPKKGP